MRSVIVAMLLSVGFLPHGSPDWPSEQTAKPSVSSKEEVEKLAWQYWNQIFSKCGDTYYAGENKKGIAYIFDFSTDYRWLARKLVTVSVDRPDQLDEADKLNKTIWKGMVSFRFAEASCTATYGEGDASGKVLKITPWS